MASYDGRYDRELKLFTDAMRTKLAANVRKGKWENMNLAEAFRLLRNEVDELEEAISRGNSIEILLEAADIGNFALIISDVAMREAINGKKEDPVTEHKESDGAGPGISVRGVNTDYR